LSGERAIPPWYQDGLRFECQRCGRCCRGEPGFVWVREVEIAAIARFLKMPEDEFMQAYVRVVSNDYSLVELRNGDCIFWSPEGCRIYEVRPVQCRTFPFWNEYTRSERQWREAARRCPGVNRGRVYPAAEIEHLVRLTDF